MISTVPLTYPEFTLGVKPLIVTTGAEAAKISRGKLRSGERVK
jgi:hypothetical protein